MDLIERIKAQYVLDWSGTHGVSHWRRVDDNALAIATTNGANEKIIHLFAVLHDACRLNEDTDDGHGRRGADFAVELRGEYFDLPNRDFDLLYYAIDKHSDGLIEADVTVQTCWDADRLDLGRVGIKPDQRYLCTEAGKIICGRL